MLFFFGFILLGTKFTLAQSSHNNSKKIIEDNLYLTDYSKEHPLISDYSLSEYYSVAIWLNYPTYDENYLISKGEYHANLNNYYLTIIGVLENYDYYSSNYIPLITYNLKEYNHEEKEMNNMIANFPFVNSIEVNSMYQKYESSEEFQVTNTPPEIDIPPDAGGNNGNYTGKGIKVGIIESFYPDKTYLEDYFNKSINLEIYEQNEHNSGMHPTAVALLILDEAADVRLYSVPVGEFDNPNQINNIVAGVDQLIYRGVNIINLSFGVQANTNVHTLSKLFNYITNSNKITVVASAGNSTLHPVIQPSAAPNIISVGSLCEDNTLSYYNSYKDAFTKVPKPNIIDYDYIKLPNFNNSATSFAAPRVTAKAARLMEFSYSFRNNPQLLMSVLQAGAMKDFTTIHTLKYNSNGFEERYGTGKIDYYNSLNILTNGNYSNFYISRATSNNTTLMNRTIYLRRNEPLTISLSTLVPSSNSETVWDLESVSRFKIIIKNNNTIVKEISSDYPTIYLKYNPSKSDYYSIQIILIDNNTKNIDLKYSYAYNI